MIGDHADAVIVDAYMKGIRSFDVDKAYTLMRRNAFDQPATTEEYKDGRGRRALDDYSKLGYIPLENGVPDAFHKNEQVSRMLEYAYDDFALAQMARALGKTEDAAALMKRAGNYRNVIDPETKFAAPACRWNVVHAVRSGQAVQLHHRGSAVPVHLLRAAGSAGVDSA